MTTLDCVKIAEAIKDSQTEPNKKLGGAISKVDLITRLCSIFKDTNPDFNEEAFIKDCSPPQMRGLTKEV